MNYEEKYNEALERARKVYIPIENNILDDIFPELKEKESENEKIRKAIHIYLDWLDGRKDYAPKGSYSIKDMITWLEKQCELNNNETDILNRFSFYSYKDEPNILYLSELYVNKEQRNKGIGTKILKIADEVAANMKCNSIRLKTEIGSNAERLYRKNGYNSLKMEGNQIWLEKQGEKKPDDNVESKFKVDDWVVQENVGIYKVIKVCESWYEVIDNLNNHYSIGFDKEYMCHLWSINDAKDGDVLAAQECYVIFKEIDGLNIKCYCTYHYMNNPSFHVDTLQNKNAFHPATKEQCDTSMKAVANAGYTFDFEKKELKKIKPKTLDPDKVIEWLNHRELSCDDVVTTVIPDDSPTSVPHRVKWLSDEFIKKFKKDFGL